MDSINYRYIVAMVTHGRHLYLGHKTLKCLFLKFYFINLHEINIGNFIKPRHPVQVISVLGDIIYGNMLDRSTFKLETVLI